jgi:type IV pilus assembly protein PilM
LGILSLNRGVATTGLDIGTNTFRVAQVKPSGAGLALVTYDSIRVPMGAVAEGEIVDVDAVAHSIGQLWRKAGVGDKRVNIGVANQKVVVRHIELPFMEKSELAGAIQYQAQDFIPIPVEEAIIDFQIIGDHVSEQDEHVMEVLLVAAQRDMIAANIQAVEAAGLKPQVVDVAAFAIVRALLYKAAEFLPAEDQEQEGEALAIVHVSSGITNIVVVEEGVPRFTRVSALAGNDLTQAIASGLNIPFEDAEQLKLEVGLPGPEGRGLPADLPTETLEHYELAQDILEREVSRFVSEVRRSFDYYLTQATQVRMIRKLLLSGSGARLNHISEYLERGLQVSVALAQPLERLQVSPRIDKQLLEEDKLGSAVALGLAMRGLDV